MFCFLQRSKDSPRRVLQCFVFYPDEVTSPKNVYDKNIPPNLELQRAYFLKRTLILKNIINVIIKLAFVDTVPLVVKFELIFCSKFDQKPFHRCRTRFWKLRRNHWQKDCSHGVKIDFWIFKNLIVEEKVWIWRRCAWMFNNTHQITLR